MIRIDVLITLSQVRIVAQGNMQTTTPWEAELDAIVDAIRAGLQEDGDHAEDQKSHVAARSLTLWLDALMGILERCQRENDAEGANEAMDVIALLFKACANGQWRQLLHDHPEEARSFFLDERLQMILLALATVDEADEDGEAGSLAIDIISALLSIATHVEHAEAVLRALQKLPQRGSVRQLLQEDALLRKKDSWNAQFIQFVLRFISPQATPADVMHGIIKALSGCEEDEWISQTWETKWHVYRSAPIGRLVLGSKDQCVASLRQVFEGYSIPPVDLAASSSPSEAAVVMGLQHADDLLGLRHGVDVTFIKRGTVHPQWSEGVNQGRAIHARDADEVLTDGYTIGIRGMQARSAPVNALSESLQSKLGQHVNANLYWTPPDQRGFDIHIDDHCVFVLQLKGKKRWCLYKPLDILPNLYDDTIAALRAGLPVKDTEITLEEGDVLYVPRGVAHHADTGGMDEESIHLTIGVEIEQAHTFGRVAQELDEACTDDERWSSRFSKRERNRGLMMWHLRHADVFRSCFSEAVGVDLTVDTREALEKIRVRLLDERQLFLRGRALSARALATLHAVTANDDREAQLSEGALDNRPSKKSRQD